MPEDIAKYLAELKSALWFEDFNSTQINSIYYRCYSGNHQALPEGTVTT